MFQGLRQGSLFYILEKGDTPILKIGQVVSVSQPVPKYNTTFTPGQQFGMETVVDISVKVGDDTVDFKQLPSALSIANFGQNGVVVSESKEAMSAEVEAMLRTSRQIIDGIPYHKRVISSCDNMLRELNPQFAKEKEQEEKIGALEQKMNGMEGTLGDIREMLSKALGTSSNIKK